MKKIHIKFQAIIIAVIPILLTVAFIESFGLYSQFSEMDDALRERSKSIAKQLASSSEYAVFSGNIDSLKFNTDATLNQQDVSKVTIYDSNKNVLASSSRSGTTMLPPTNLGITSTFYENSSTLWVYESIIPVVLDVDPLMNESSLNAKPRKALGVVLIEFSKARLNERKLQILFAALLLTTFILILAVSIAYRLSKNVTNPINELGKGIVDIGQGNLDTMIPNSGVIELDQLARGINSMTAQLKNDRDNLQKRILQATEGLRQKQKQAEEANRAKSQFLSAASHDLRQPIAASSLYIDTLNLTSLDPRQKKIVTRLKESVSSMTGLLNSLLEISKLDGGMITPKIIPFDLGQLYSRIEANFQSLAENKGLRFHLSFTRKHSLLVVTDGDLIDRIVMNLVSNAIKFTSQGGVLVSARLRKKEILLQVWDTGIGMDEESIHHIYDEFFQVGNPQRDRMHGLGLGLSIVKRCVELLGIQITCHSRPGKGTVFSLRLPLLEETAIPDISKASRINNESRLKGKRFIVIEDNVLVANGLTGWIEEKGGKTIHFQNAKEVLNNPDISHSDYYVVDHMLGGGTNGIQLLNLLKQRFGKPIRAVVITGDTSTAFIKSSANCEWPILHKPIETSSLLAALEI